VENLVGYAETDLVIPQMDVWSGMADANAAAVAWCAEVNARTHSEIAAVPDDRLAQEVAVLRGLPSLRAANERGVQRKVDKLSTVRFGSARYSVPARLVGAAVWVRVDGDRVAIDHDDACVARHPLVAPGEVSLDDAHYGGPATPPARPIRPRTAVEKQFIGLGGPAEAFLRAAAAAGQTRLPRHLADIVALEAAWGRDAVAAALTRATAFGRFAAADVRSILAAGSGIATPATPGGRLGLDMPDHDGGVGLDAFRLDRLEATS
jgi:hypothetical protein